MDYSSLFQYFFDLATIALTLLKNSYFLVYLFNMF